MAKKEIVSIFTVTELKTGKQIEEAIIGCGQEAIRYLRKQYPKFTKFVLDGFEVDGQFFPLQLKAKIV